MAITSEKIWLDGEFVPFAEATVHVLTHTLHYGLGAFEGLRCYKRANGESCIFRLEDHIKRLHRSAKIGDMKLPWSVEEICEAAVELVRLNKFGDCYIRPLVFIGDGEMGLAATSNPIRLAIACWKWGSYLGNEGLKHGVRAKVASYARNDIRSGSSKAKICGNYVNSIFAKREIQKAGYEEAILLDTDGYVSEASGENIFVVFNGDLCTTPLGSSILEGITRHTIMTLAEEEGYKVKERRFTRDMLYTADEVFCVGTAAEITPIRSLDDREIGEGCPGPITKKMQTRYFDHVRGTETSHPEWRTVVK